MDEVAKIFLIDCILGFTEVITDGNVDDGNYGNTPDLEFSRWFCGVIYIGIFSVAIVIHSLTFLIEALSTCKNSIKKKHKVVKTDFKKEIRYQKSLKKLKTNIMR